MELPAQHFLSHIYQEGLQDLHQTEKDHIVDISLPLLSNESRQIVKEKDLNKNTKAKRNPVKFSQANKIRYCVDTTEKTDMAEKIGGNCPWVN